jgi:hypothetical protein
LVEARKRRRLLLPVCCEDSLNNLYRGHEGGNLVVFVKVVKSGSPEVEDEGNNLFRNLCGDGLICYGGWGLLPNTKRPINDRLPIIII